MKKLGIFALLMSFGMFVGCGDDAAEKKDEKKPATTPADTNTSATDEGDGAMDKGAEDKGTEDKGAGEGGL